MIVLLPALLVLAVLAVFAWRDWRLSRSNDPYRWVSKRKRRKLAEERAERENMEHLLDHQNKLNRYINPDKDGR